MSCVCVCFKYSCSIGTVPLPEENWNIGSPGQSNHVTCDNQLMISSDEFGNWHLPLPGQSCFVTCHPHHHRHEVINYWKQMWCYLPYHEQISQSKIPIWHHCDLYSSNELSPLAFPLNVKQDRTLLWLFVFLIPRVAVIRVLVPSQQKKWMSQLCMLGGSSHFISRLVHPG